MGGARRDIRERRGKMAVESRVTQEEIKKEPEKPIDREKVSGVRGGRAAPLRRPLQGGQRGWGEC